MATKRKTTETQFHPHDKEPKETKPTHALKIRIDDLKTFQPLTNNQKIFFEIIFSIKLILKYSIEKIFLLIN